MTPKRVLLIDVDPALVEFGPASLYTPDLVREASDSAEGRLLDIGYDVRCCMLDLGMTAEAVLMKALVTRSTDIVMIGVGLRTLPQHTLLFEKVINLVHQHAPLARLCFSSNPHDIVESVRRWA